MSAPTTLPAPGTPTTVATTSAGSTQTVTTKVDVGLPLVPTLILLGLFVLLAIGLLAWGLYNQDLVNTRDLSLTQSPYCPQFICNTGTTKTNYQLDPSADPNTSTYQTLNFCTINAPPTSFVQSLEVCGGLLSSDSANAGGSTIPPATAKQVTDFAAFYNQQYVDTCGWSWRNPPPEDPSQTDPQTDPVITALIACAQKNGVENNSDVQDLQKKCPSCADLLPTFLQ